MPRIRAHPSDNLADNSSDPDFLMIHSDPTHVWIGDTHYVESGNRLAKPGKCYFMQAGLSIGVVDVNESEDEPVTRYGVDNAEDEVIFESLYDLNHDGSYLQSKRRMETDESHRFHLKSEQAFSIGDVSPIPFDTENDGSSWPVVTGITADTYHDGGRIESGPANYL